MPRANSVRIAVAVLGVLLTLAWATVNMRPVPAGSQAVLLRFGRIAGVQQSGLVLALPPPFEEIVLLPGAQQSSVLTLRVSSAAYLTGDGGLVLLEAAIEWRIADAASYCVVRAQVAEALRRVFLSAVVALAAARPLDDFLATPSAGVADPAAQESRRAMRDTLVAAVNARLAALTRAGMGLGVEVTGAAVTASLPPSAKSGFNLVPQAGQGADDGLAAARIAAAQTRQQAEQARDEWLSGAHASAAERVAAARASVATIAALQARMDPAARSNAMDEMYRDRIGPILRQAGSISAVDAKSVSRLILPGAQ